MDTTKTVTTTALCGFGRHDACEDRRLHTTAHCECDCHVQAAALRPGPALLVLPATFHPLRGFIAHRPAAELHTLLACEPSRLEAVVVEDGWTLFADVDRDDKSLPPNGYARRLLDVLGVGRARYLGGTCVIAGEDAEGALCDVPAHVLNAARDCALIVTNGANA